MSQVNPESLLEELNRLEGFRDEGQAASSQRAYERLPVRGQADLCPTGRNNIDTHPIEVHLRDVGRGGIGFICDRELPKGSTWRINFIQHGYTIGQHAVVVRYARQIEDAVYLIGGQFVLDEGLMILLGVDPKYFRDADAATHDHTGDFIAPEDAAA